MAAASQPSVARSGLHIQPAHACLLPCTTSKARDVIPLLLLLLLLLQFIAAIAGHHQASKQQPKQAIMATAL
jgi:hypothetical protein